jgi:preprotein translocase subunit SecA
MIDQIIKSIFGDPSEKRVKEISKIISNIHQAEVQFKNYTLDDVKMKTAEFKSMFE